MNRGQQAADRKWSGFDSRQRVAGLSSNEQLAGQRAASLNGRYQPLLDRANTQFSSGALSQYTNPYRDNVIDIQARRINQDYDKRLSDLSAKRGMMDAFGTDRGTMLETELQKQRSQALRDSEYTGLSDAFNFGTQAFFGDRDAALRGAQTQAGLDTNEIGALSATGANERGLRQAGADFDYGQFLEQRDWSVNNMAPLIAAIQGADASAGSTQKSTTETKQSTGGMLAGLASTVAGAFMTGGFSTLGAGLAGAALGGGGGGGGGSIVPGLSGMDMSSPGAVFGGFGG